MIWSDDFSGDEDSLPNTDKWLIDTGTRYSGGRSRWGTGEIETYTTSTDNLRLTGNNTLLITPIYTWSTNTWTSARIETQNTSFRPAAGKKLRVQASIALPQIDSSTGAGYWPAFWMLGHAFRDNYQNWPRIGEIDIMEAANDATHIYQTLHCDSLPGGACNEPYGLGSVVMPCGSDGQGCGGDFHTFAIEIDRTMDTEELRWYIDGALTKTITSSWLGEEIWTATINQGFFLLLNVAIGGSMPDAIYGSTTPVSSTVSGQSMEVGYVAVYEST